MWHWSKDIPKDMQQQRNRTTDTHSQLVFKKEAKNTQKSLKTNHAETTLYFKNEFSYRS